MRPQGRKAKSMAGGITQLWRASGETCPQGTVPIRRTTEEEALRVRKYERKLVEGAGESPSTNHEVRMVGVLVVHQKLILGGIFEESKTYIYIYIWCLLFIYYICVTVCNWDGER